MTHRVGIVCCGNISDTHARAELEGPGVEGVAVHGRNTDRGAAMAARYGAQPYESLESMLEHPGLALVLIGSTSGVHAEQGRAAVARGIHVLAEKPLDVTTERID